MVVMMVWSLQCCSGSSSWQEVRNYCWSQSCIMNESVDRNIVACWCVIPSGWPEVMNYSGVVVKTLYRDCVIIRNSGWGILK